ncbi:MAG: hypothetical protein LBT86_05670 [Deltaproteobacteria bacterium]|jgi:hypothetical protein|nr:hypothetical protein [Deltaproteobacteria bacterium]
MVTAILAERVETRGVIDIKSVAKTYPHPDGSEALALVNVDLTIEAAKNQITMVMVAHGVDEAIYL